MGPEKKANRSNLLVNLANASGHGVDESTMARMVESAKQQLKQMCDTLCRDGVQQTIRKANLEIHTEYEDKGKRIPPFEVTENMEKVEKVMSDAFLQLLTAFLCSTAVNGECGKKLMDLEPGKFEGLYRVGPAVGSASEDTQKVMGEGGATTQLGGPEQDSAQLANTAEDDTNGTPSRVHCQELAPPLAPVEEATDPTEEVQDTLDDWLQAALALTEAKLRGERKYLNDVKSAALDSIALLRSTSPSSISDAEAIIIFNKTIADPEMHKAAADAAARFGASDEVQRTPAVKKTTASLSAEESSRKVVRMKSNTLRTERSNLVCCSAVLIEPGVSN